MGLAFVPIYIKYLGIEAYGLIGLFVVLQAWLTLLDMGMTATLGREIARYTGGTHSNESIRDLLRSIEIITLCIGALIASGAALGSNWIATSWLKVDALSSDDTARAFAVMGLVAALRFGEGVYRSAIIGLQRQVLFNLVISLMASIRAFGAVGILVWVSPTIRAFFLWQGIISVATLVILSSVTYAKIPKGVRGGRFSLEAMRSVWCFARGMMGITFLALLLTQVDKVLLSKLLTLHDFGYYTLASTVAGALSIMIAPITQAFYPRFCELHVRGDTQALVENYHKGAQLVSVIAGSVAIVLIFYSETFLHLWTQDAELAARVAMLLSLLVLGNLLNGLMWIPYQMQLAHGWTKFGIYINSVAVLLIVPFIFYVVPRYGSMGAALVWVVLNVAYGLIAMQFAYRKILPTEKWRWYYGDVLAPLIASALGVGVVKIFLPCQSAVTSQIFSLVVASISAVLLSGLAACHVRRQLLIFIQILWKKIYE